MSDNLQEFIVTLKRHEDLESFYEDMETEGGDLYIPNRTVNITQRRPLSRNTHYLLTNEEAETLRQDSRVEAVALAAIELAAIRPAWTQTGIFDKSSGVSNTYTNWALLRCIEGTQRTDWGSNATVSQTDNIKLGASGKNVDVVIIDGHVNPDHPEYAVNNDGSGGSRVVQFDWYTLNSTVGALDNDGETLLSGSYVYTPYYDAGDANLSADNNHGAHVAGTVAGNTQGWARDANIYNISPYSSNPNGTVGSLLMWDYIRAFHRTKFIGKTYSVTNSGTSSYQIDSSSNPSITLQRGLTYTFNVSSTGHPFWIKTSQTTGTGSSYDSGVTNNGIDSGTVTFTVPLDAPDTLYYICQFHSSMTGTFNVTGTGRKNPTICNCSYGSAITFPDAGIPTTGIKRITYRGTTTGNGTTLLSTAEIIGGGLYAIGATAEVPYYSSAAAADIADAIADGIIIVAAAGNEYQLIDTPTGQDYGNTFVAGYGGVDYLWYSHRGTAPGSAPGVICVGSVGSTSSETKSSFSNCGPRIDIFAPGHYIMSSLNQGGVSDSRSSGTTYYLAKYSGTSMASPQVCGVAACILEQNPHWSQEQLKDYLIGTATTDQVGDTGGGASDATALQGAPNRYLYIRKDRPDEGLSVPRNNQGLRPQTGQTWPRPKIYRYG